MGKKAASFLLLCLLLGAGCLANHVPAPSDDERYLSREERLHRLLVDPAVGTIAVDVDYVEGRMPSDLALDGLRENLENVAPHRRISIPPPTPIQINDASREREWTTEQLMEIAERHYEGEKDSTATIHVLYLNGKYSVGNRHNVGGVFMEWVDAAFVFRDHIHTYLVRVDDIYLPHPAADEYDRAVLSHEVGHALGLVGFGVPMLTYRLPPVDADPCQCHSVQEDSVLYYRDLSDAWVRDKLESGQHIPYRYNSDDRADLAAFIKGYG